MKFYFELNEMVNTVKLKGGFTQIETQAGHVLIIQNKEYLITCDKIIKRKYTPQKSFHYDKITNTLHWKNKSYSIPQNVAVHFPALKQKDLTYKQINSLMKRIKSVMDAHDRK